MAATTLSTAARNAKLDALTAQIGNAGKFRVYDGTRPAGGGAATNLLAEFTMGTPFAAAAAAGVLSPTLPSATTGLFAGTATWGRFTTSAGTYVMDADCNTGAGPIVINNASIVIGQAVSMTLCTFTEGNP